MLRQSDEQLAVTNAAVVSGCNVIVSAKAGSGKTTNILSVGNALPDEELALVLTYNKKLKEETRERARSFNLSHKVEIHSFHALGVKYYGTSCARDNGLKEVVDGKLRQSKRIPNYRVFVLDEAQDLKKLLFRFFLKFAHDCFAQNGYVGKAPQIMFFGDQRQSIYKFAHSDERYLTFAERIFENTIFSNNTWRRLPLSTSFRITGNMARVLNVCMLRTVSDPIKSIKPAGEKVTYIIGGAYRAAVWLPKEIGKLHTEHNIPYHDMVILAPSVATANNSKTPLALLINRLANMGVMIHKTSDGEQGVDEKVAHNKLLFTTFHQSKGIERRVVIVFQFDKSYFQWYVNRNKDRPKVSERSCPNTLYVACTRAKEHLFLVAEEYYGEHLPFLFRTRMNEMHEQSDAIKIVDLHKTFSDFYTGRDENNEIADEPVKEVMVTDLLRFLPQHIESYCMSKLRITKLNIGRPDSGVALPLTAKFRAKSGLEYKEQVADLNGLAIPALFELRSTGKVSMLKDVKLLISRRGDEVKETLWKHFTKFQERVPEITDIAHLLELSAIYQAAFTNYVHKLSQLQNYDWLNGRDVNTSVEYLNSLVEQPSKAEFEFVVTFSHPNYPSRVIKGSFDILSQRMLYEVKCVSLLSDIHFIQLAMYAWLWTESFTELTRKFQLVDIVRGEVWELEPLTATSLDEIASAVIKQHLSPHTNDWTDEVFLSKAQGWAQRTLSQKALTEVGCTLKVIPAPKNKAKGTSYSSKEDKNMYLLNVSQEIDAEVLSNHGGGNDEEEVEIGPFTKSSSGSTKSPRRAQEASGPFSRSYSSSSKSEIVDLTSDTEEDIREVAATSQQNEACEANVNVDSEGAYGVGCNADEDYDYDDEGFGSDYDSGSDSGDDVIEAQVQNMSVTEQPCECDTCRNRRKAEALAAEFASNKDRVIIDLIDYESTVQEAVKVCEKVEQDERERKRRCLDRYMELERMNC